MRDLEAIGQGLCDASEQARCAEESGGAEFIEWACSQCGKKKPEDLHEYTCKILRLRKLKIAGYPFRADDLTIEDWTDLGKLEEMMATREKVQEISNLAQILGIKLIVG